MSEFDAAFLEEEQKLPKGLNVLTILTFIGSGLGLLSSLWQFSNGKKTIEAMEKVINDPTYDSMPDFVKSMNSPEALAELQKIEANKLPLLVLGLVGAGLCIWGAIEMRKRKMSGYFSYVIGCVLPLLGYIVFLGAASAKSTNYLIGAGFTLLFILLYTFQRKHLTNK
jgi:hypothetical protein